MDLILRDILRKSGLWESYKTKHNIVENVSIWNLIEPHMPAAEEVLYDDIGGGFSEEYLTFEYNIEHGHGEYDDIEEEEQEQYQEWVKEKIEELIYLSALTLKNVTTENGEIMLYRVITAPLDWVRKGGLTARPLGEFWSWEENAAEAHWGEFGAGHEQYLLVAAAAPQDVDWVKSLYANANPSSDEEKEIALLPGTKVRFHGVYVKQNRTPVSVDSGLEGQILQAA